MHILYGFGVRGGDVVLRASSLVEKGELCIMSETCFLMPT